MSAHPTRRANRRRGLSGIARAPIAFAGTENAHRIDARERMRRDVPRLLDASDTETGALVLGVTPLQFAFANESRPDALTVSSPARDSRGRVLRHERYKARRTSYTI